MLVRRARLRTFAPLPLWALGAVLLSGAMAAAQEAPASDAGASSLVLHTTVHRVIVDVVVLDDKGQPVRGLSAKDFSVAEEGKAQRILSFEEHDMDADPDGDTHPHPAAALPVNTFVNVPPVPERGPLNVILYDMLDTSMDDQPYARLQMLKFVDEMPEGSRFAIFVLADGLHLAQGFTSNRDQLHAILDARNRSHIPKVFLYGDNYHQSVSPLGALADIARFLDGMPGRKNLIWLSDHFPVPFLPNLTHAGEERQNNDERLHRVTNVMAAGQIALYPIDVRGVAMGNLTGDNHILNGEYLAEDGMAEATGGRAFHSTNDLRTAISEAAENGSRYYTLSYAPSSEKWDGGLRRIHIQAAHPGYRLEYRHSYFANDDAPRPGGKAGQKAGQKAEQKAELTAEQGRNPSPDLPTSQLQLHLVHGAPIVHELRFEMHVHSVPAEPESAASARGSKRGSSKSPPVQTLAIEYRIDSNQLQSDNARPGSESTRSPAPDLEFVCLAYDSAGRLLNMIVQKSLHGSGGAAQADIPAPRPGGMYRVRQQIEVPAQTAWLRVAARDLVTGRVGTMEVALPLAPEPTAESVAPMATFRRAASAVAPPESPKPR